MLVCFGPAFRAQVPAGCSVGGVLWRGPRHDECLDHYHTPAWWWRDLPRYQGRHGRGRKVCAVAGEEPLLLKAVYCHNARSRPWEGNQ